MVYEKRALGDWLPQPAKVIQDAVREFAGAHFGRTVGMHIRSGDNGMNVVTTPLDDFINEAERVVADDYTVFLATDSVETENVMRDRFGDRIIVFPKGWDLPFRWPRMTSTNEAVIPDWLEHQLGAKAPDSRVADKELVAAGEELVPDFVDMQLLAACDHVIGSTRSSFSHLAARYNGSPRCLLLSAPPVDPVLGKALGPIQKWRNRGIASGRDRPDEVRPS